MYKDYGFIRVGALVPELKVADTIYNTEELIKEIKKASEKNINVIVTPELSLTGYTCDDLFYQNNLIKECEEGLRRLAEETKNLDIISIIGVPVKYKNKLYNTAVVVQRGEILGIIPKLNINSSQQRWFTSGNKIEAGEITLCGKNIPINKNLLFRDKENKDFCFGIEIGDDLSSLNPPSNNHALNGATIIFNPAASNEIVGRYEYRKNLLQNQSARTISAYCYTSSGVGESSTDFVFSGHSMIVENGKLLKENNRFELTSNLIYIDIDVERLINERIRNNTYFNDCFEEYQFIDIDINVNFKNLERTYKEYPFVPSNKDTRDKRYREIIEIQACGLAKRLKATGVNKTVIGISGGLDSTLAYLVIIEAYKKLGLPLENIIGVTMPGFGTTNRTYDNACNLIKKTGATLMEVSIKDACLQHFKDIGVNEEDRSVTYENAQARERTQILMDIANKEGALVVGTGDLSELALGWCTYNGDHMSMYAVNAGVPKTLVRHLVSFESELVDEELGLVLKDILDTPISPELLPPDKYGKIKQKTENSIGPYVLHDFFLYHFFKTGASPEKIFELACHTFKGKFTKEEIKKWELVFFKRFFSSQFKRSCIPDGPKIGSVGLSPRGDLKMPSDASLNIWLTKIKKL